MQQETERLVGYFQENPDTDAYFAVLDIGGNTKVRSLREVICVRSNDATTV